MAATKWSAGSWRRTRAVHLGSGNPGDNRSPDDTPGPHEMQWTICSFPAPPPIFMRRQSRTILIGNHPRPSHSTYGSTTRPQPSRFPSNLTQSGRQRHPWRNMDGREQTPTAQGPVSGQLSPWEGSPDPDSILPVVTLEPSRHREAEEPVPGLNRVRGSLQESAE